MKQLDNQFPISLKHIDHILERVYDRYPQISKHEISLIVKTFFETMRSILVSGNSISISNFVSKISLIAFSRTSYNKNYRVVKAKVSTPKKIKNG